jgi:hypothetical protein
MDTKYVIFGRVISGMRAFKLLQKVDVVNEKPAQSVKIVATGEYKIGGLSKKSSVVGEAAGAEGEAVEA